MFKTCCKYIDIHFQVHRFLCKPSFTMLRPSVKYGGIFFSKRATENTFHEGDFGGKFMDRSINDQRD